MPIISEFYGIKIMMFWNDHYPPHFHAEYGENKILVDIESATVLKGIFPSKQLKLVLAWCEIHKHELMTNWENGKGNNQFIRINPLV
ncbi:MAG: DUF4160 domain-containing protein [Desulfitobacteriaceae bacterium]|nr:DUF4160 domain-containing protein [Desulfitobacteriaceae bacterium]